MRNKVSNGLWGLLFILAGVAFLGNAYDWWDFNLFFSGWWTLFIIIPCAVSIIRHGFNTGSIIGLGIGVILLLSAQDVLSYVSIWKLIVPLILVAIGLSIIFGGTFNRFTHEQIKIPNRTGNPDYTAIFCANAPNYQNEVFTGCTTSAIFGAVELNLKNAIINEDCIINASAIFGGIDIFLPPNVNVKVNSTPIFGGVDNKAMPTIAINAPTVYINATCIFGGIDIK